MIEGTRSVDLKIGVLRHLRDLFHRRSLTKAVLEVNLTLVAADLGIDEDIVRQLLAELIRLKLAKPYENAPPHTAAADGRAEITAEGLGYLHQIETDRANAEFMAALAAENIRLQAGLAVQLPEAKTSLKQAGFKAT